MGIFTIDCTACSKPFQWFSGDPTQRCPECAFDNNIKKAEILMQIKSPEVQVIEALNQTIKVQSDFIEHLKSEIQVLKNQALTAPNIVQMPYNQQVPLYPNIQPFYQPGTLVPPLTPPYVVTCTTNGVNGVTTPDDVVAQIKSRV